MKNQFLLSVICIALSMFYLPSSVQAQAFVNAESGAVFTGYNNVRIPGDVGTLFSLKTDLSPQSSAFLRLRAGYTINSKHTISALYAPLTIKSSGSLSFPINYERNTFAANTPLDATYTFNSYRLTYRYRFVQKPKFEFGLGFTAKIRDAEIAIASADKRVSKTNIGFVPIINFRLNWKVNEKIGLLFEGDALAVPQGRAEDVLLAGTYKFSDKLTARLGYRLLEGGAGNDEVYNFTLFHYASIGLTYTFKK
ncbi:MAG: hypothetical protein ACI8Q1_000799 [Parvicella sp.]|jgi:hypothetical protein